MSDTAAAKYWRTLVQRDLFIATLAQLMDARQDAKSRNVDISDATAKMDRYESTANDLANLIQDLRESDFVKRLEAGEQSPDGWEDVEDKFDELVRGSEELIQAMNECISDPEAL
ncbi:hypothetical protein F4677DRAFT_459090 [Hypoxylon crocopeplum]|nr:hypothetical protein F4677DRAFT_459090 [Hypoxylon crocopeplum]